MFRAMARLFLCLALPLVLFAGAAAARNAGYAEGELIVKFRSEGDYALVECVHGLLPRAALLREDIRALGRLAVGPLPRHPQPAGDERRDAQGGVGHGATRQRVLFALEDDRERLGDGSESHEFLRHADRARGVCPANLVGNLA